MFAGVSFISYLLLSYTLQFIYNILIGFG